MYNVEIIRNAANGQRSREEHNVPERVYGVTGNWGVAEQETEAKERSYLYVAEVDSAKAWRRYLLYYLAYIPVQIFLQ